MSELKDNQYFFILKEIDLFPEIKSNTIQMIEQLMNAYVLINKHNIQQSINYVLELEYYCKSLLNEDYLAVLSNEQRIHIAKGEQVQSMYPLYHKNKYYRGIGKQTAINLGFLEKKLSYDGVKIIWEDTYIDWINEIIQDCRKKSRYNSADSLIYQTIEPKVLNQHIETRDIILNETLEYARQCQQQLQLQKMSVQ